MTLRGLILPICFAVSLITVSTCPAKDSDVDPAQTKLVLNILLSASNELIPVESSCNAHYGQSGQARVRDLLSMELAYSYQGKNTITGECNDTGDKQCVLFINRATGEDVSSTEIRFSMRKGKIKMSTMCCVITP